MRALTGTWLCALALMRAASAGAATPVPYGSADTQYWNGAHGQKWAIDTIPLTNTTKPAGYP